MVRIKRFFILSIIPFFFSTSAEAFCPVNTNWYADGNIGKAAIHKNYPGSIRASGGAWSIAVGYRPIPFIGAEAGYTRYPDIRIVLPNRITALDKHYAYHFAAKLMLPLWSSGFEIYGKLGLGRLNSNVIVGGSDPTLPNQNYYVRNSYYAAGAQYYVMPNLALGIQWSRATGDNRTGTINFYSLGASVGFGAFPGFIF